MRKKIIIFLLVFILCFICRAWAATYYISPSGNDSTGDGSTGTPWKTFNKCFGEMSAGDTLILKDGTYSEAAGTGYISYLGTGSAQAPSGSSTSVMTIVQAENEGSVTVDGGSNGGLFVGRSTAKHSYVKFQGITFLGGGQLYNTSYVYLKNCGFYSDNESGGAVFTVGTSDHANGNTYNLIEDCWIWGQERLIAINYRADYTVWRRVIIRGDGGSSASMTGSGNPNVGLSIYDSANVSAQNVIIVDRILGSGYPYADFATAQHTDGSYLLGPNEWLGCMSLDGPDTGFYFEADYSNANTVTMRNCVSWSPASLGLNISSPSWTEQKQDNIDVQNMTIGYTGDVGCRIRDNDTGGGILKNCVVTNAGTYGISTTDITRSYCDVYGSGTAAYYSDGAGTGDKSTDPENDGTPASLQYICRIESGSALDGTGDGGADFGANIVYKYGTDGAFHGDSGYNTLSANALWPWPNESRIRSDFLSQDNDSTEARGFCAGTDTLTNYVWDYLDNGNPYGDPDTTAPSAVSDLAASTGSAEGEIDLTWTAPGDDAGTGTATTYDIRRADAVIDTDEKFNAATEITGEPTPNVAGSNESMTVTGLTAGNTYYFAIKTSDEVPNTSSLSNSPSASAQVEITYPSVQGCTSMPSIGG